MTNCHKMLALYNKTVSMASRPSVDFVVHIDLPQNTKDIYKHNYTKDTLIDSLSLWSSLGKVALIVLVRMLFCSSFKFSKSSNTDCFM